MLIFTSLSRRSYGFALLEAVISLALMAGSGWALFSWIHQNLQTAIRIEERQRESRALLNAQAYLSTVNPATHPVGEFAIPGIKVSWRSVLVQPLEPNSGLAPGLHGTWLIGLYDVVAEVRGETPESPLVTFRVKRPGWKSIQDARVR
jgi:general secretion pathway protein I